LYPAGCPVTITALHPAFHGDIKSELAIEMYASQRRVAALIRKKQTKKPIKNFRIKSKKELILISF
jgi:hypothetical protein